MNSQAVADALGAYGQEAPPAGGTWRLVLRGVPLTELAPGQAANRGHDSARDHPVGDIVCGAVAGFHVVHQLPHRLR